MRDLDNVIIILRPRVMAKYTIFHDNVFLTYIIFKFFSTNRTTDKLKLYETKLGTILVWEKIAIIFFLFKIMPLCCAIERACETSARGKDCFLVDLWDIDVGRTQTGSFIDSQTLRNSRS